MIDFQVVFAWIRDAIAVTRIVLVPLLAAIFASAILSMPSQMQEYYRLLVENVFDQLRPQEFQANAMAIVFAFSSVAVMAACLAFSTRVLLIARSDLYPFSSRFWRAVYRWAPAAIGAMPLAATAYGLSLAGDLGKVEAAEQVVDQFRALGDRSYSANADGLAELLDWSKSASRMLQFTSFATLGLALVFVVLSRLIYNRASSGTGFYAFTIRPVSAIVTGAATLGVILLLLSSRVEFPQNAGTIAVFAVFMSFLTLVASQLSIWSRASGIPLTAILVFLALVFSLLDLNDNHELRRVGPDGASLSVIRSQNPAAANLPSLDREFQIWYQHRAAKNAAQLEKGNFPVYIVAAQGGGIYAAAQALMFLTGMQATCERFAEHVFAVSGVSGGSVGATLYSGLASAFESGTAECTPFEAYEGTPSSHMGRLRSAATDLVVRDYLSPLVGGMLFPDFAQRFLPFAVPSWSRARALEEALERGWDEVASRRGPLPSQASNPLRLGLVQSWDPRGLRPALLLNTTEAGSGRRRVVAPFTFEGLDSSDLRLLPLSAAYDVPLSAAAVASARFPWLTPAAWFKDPGTGAQSSGTPSKYRIVDGGYFENSGVATAIDLIDNLERIARRHRLPVQFHLISLTSGGFHEDTFQGLGEIIAPVMSLLNTRRARTHTTVELADRKLGPLDPSAADGAATSRIRRLQRVEIRDLVTPLPLGWRLSRSSAFQILMQAGLIRNCSPNEKFEQQLKNGAFSTADCVRLLIYHQIRGDDLTEALTAAQRRAAERAGLGPNAGMKPTQKQ